MFFMNKPCLSQFQNDNEEIVSFQQNLQQNLKIILNLQEAKQ